MSDGRACWGFGLRQQDVLLQKSEFFCNGDSPCARSIAVTKPDTAVIPTLQLGRRGRGRGRRPSAASAQGGERDTSGPPQACRPVSPKTEPRPLDLLFCYFSFPWEISTIDINTNFSLFKVSRMFFLNSVENGALWSTCEWQCNTAHRINPICFSLWMMTRWLERK